MTNETYMKLCKRVMASGYTIEELVEDVNANLKAKKITVNDMFAYLWRKKYMRVDVEMTLCKIFGLRYEKTKIIKVKKDERASDEAKRVYAIIDGTKKGILEKIKMTHDESYKNEVEEKLDVLMAASYSYGLEMAKHEELSGIYKK